MANIDVKSLQEYVNRVAGLSEASDLSLDSDIYQDITQLSLEDITKLSNLGEASLTHIVATKNSDLNDYDILAIEILAKLSDLEDEFKDIFETEDSEGSEENSID